MSLGDAGLSLLLDPDRLTVLVGRPVRATHLRAKPGVSATATLMDEDDRPWGWVRTLTGQARVKGDKARAVADEVGLAGELREAELPGRDTVVQWGPVATDPRLARELARVARVLTVQDATVLRYNPLRRLVLRHDDLVLRVTEDRHRRRLVGTTRPLAAAGVPVVGSWRAHPAASSRTSVWSWVPGRDASGTTDLVTQRAVGEALGRLHRADPALLPDLPRRGWAQLRAAAADSVALLEQVAPGAASAAARALARLPEQDPGPHLPQVVVHGDFSLDQCVVAGKTPAPVVRLLDLDRAALGAPVLDHAVLLATALASDDPVLDAPGGLAALGEGYATRTGRPVAVPGAWAAAALLARVAEPWRGQRPGWQVETARRSLLAARLAQEEDAWAERAPGRQVITVQRAWPGRARDGVRETTVEGRDADGRLRAGTVGPDGIPRVLPPGTDPRLPALSRVAPLGEVVVHRAGRRAVVRTADAYVKVLRPGRAPAVARAGAAGAALARAAGLAAPEVLGSDEDTVTFAVLPGRSVHELSADPGWTEVWRAWAQAWTRLQALGPGDAAAAGLPTHTGDDEAGVVETWVGRAVEAGLLDDLWARRGREVADRLREAGDPVRLVPTHRDLHDKQLLWDGAAPVGRRLGVLDLDTACLADPVLDPVNLAVHADLRRAQGLWSATASGVVVAAARSVVDDADRWAVAELATVVRLVCVYAFRPQWRETVARWAEDRWERADESSLIDVSRPSPADRAFWVS
ncbi:phosphotransferase [Ornithinimicrobium kibberense]|uniref:Phosphotransferase n=2 Tax=Ornithinimicrobium kibberense TaxID=282060 RepID=A0ABV5V0S9_9MICO|nr:aminoglycoside phosphotransferase family protein [Ornithinimicrobium kibberense]